MRRMLNKKRCLTLTVLGLLTINLCSIMSSSADVEIIDLSIHIPMCEPKTKYGNSVWIRGIWHFVNITLDDEAGKVSIVFYQGVSPLGSEYRNETNYYEWEYDDGSWRDVQHSPNYMEVGYCNHDTGFYSFYIGIDQYVEIGNWTLELFADDEQLHLEQIYVDNTVASLGLKTIPVTIRAEPFTEDYYVSEEKFTVENDGNVPLKLSVNYGGYEDIFSTLDFNEILKPSETAKYNIQLRSKSTWKPGKLTIKAGDANVNGKVLYIIPPKKLVSLIESNLLIGLPINVYIGHSGYDLEILAEDIIFQYEKTMDIYYGETKDVFTYLSGNGTVTVNITGENLEILNIFSGGVEVETPFTVKSTNTSEYPIVVRVRGIRPNTTAYLYYDLETGREHQFFTTTINVGPPLPIEEFNTTLLIELLLIICIIIAVVYMVYTQMKHRGK